MIILDTHVLLWLVAGDNKLGTKTRAVIDKAYQQNNVGVCAISFWEVALFKQKSRIEFDDDVANWRKELLRQGVLEIVIDGDLGVYSTMLEDFHSDPADRFIVASALLNRATLLTADNKILNWNTSLKCMDARQ